MNKDLIQKEYKKKLNLLNHYNQKYYNDNISEITDSEYDKLKKDIINLEKNHGFLKSKNSPTKTVGYKPSKNFKKVLHKVPMLSLGNAFSQEDLFNFEKRFISKSKFNEYKMFTSCESIYNFYMDGSLYYGLRRYYIYS